MNAWMGTDNREDRGDAVGRTEGRGTRARPRLSEQAVIAQLRSWLLQEYVRPYGEALGATRIFRRCYWIDALGLKRTRATPVRRNEDRENRLLINEVAALDVVDEQEDEVVFDELREVRALGQKLSQANKPITLYGILVSAGAKRGAKRGKGQGDEDGAVVLPRESGVINGNWWEVAPVLLQAIDQSPAIFLLNPLAPQVLGYEQMAPLYQRAVPTELCLLIGHKQLALCLQVAGKEAEWGAMLTALLRSDRWKLLPKGDDGQKEATEEAVAGFCALLCASMQRHFQLPPQRIKLPMQVGAANVVDAPYSLVYASRRPDSLLRMNDAVRLYWRRTIEQSSVGVLGEEWFVRQEEERRASALAQLEQQIRQVGMAQRTRRWPDLRQQLVLAQFGRFTQMEYDQIIQRFLEQHVVRCVWKQGVSAETERVPEQHDTLMWEGDEMRSGRRRARG